MWRWLATTEPRAPRRRRQDRYEITEADRDAYATWRGNVAAVHPRPARRHPGRAVAAAAAVMASHRIDATSVTRHFLNDDGHPAL